MNIVMLDFRQVLWSDEWFKTMYRRLLVESVVFTKYHEFVVKSNGYWYERTDSNGWVMTIRPEEGFIEKYDGKQVVESGYIKAITEITDY